MSENKMNKCLMDYFTYLDSSYKTCKQILTQCSNNTHKIYSLVEQQNKLNRANLTDTPLEQFPDLIERLNFSINNEINCLCKQLQNSCSTLENDYKTLHKKMLNIERNCSDIDFRENNSLIDGNCYQPNLSYLIEYSLDGTQIFNDVWTQVKYALHQITSNRNKCDFSKTINEYKLKKSSEERIKHILMMTQFCNKIEL